MIEHGLFPSETTERKGHFVGISEHVGKAMTYKILTDDTNKIIHRSSIRSALQPHERNMHADAIIGETDTQNPKSVIKSKYDYGENNSNCAMPTIKPADLIGRTFLMAPREDGQRFQAKIVEAIIRNEGNLEKEPERQDGGIDEDNIWKFKRISAHEGPLLTTDKSYNGSAYNVLVEWETGESTFEPLHLVAADNPVTCAIYGKDNNLLDQPGRKSFKKIAKRQQKLLCFTNQSKLRSYRTVLTHQYGFLVPKGHDQAVEIDRKNGNTK
jgi:hypothetical protein